MPLSKGTNAYATVEEADAHFADRLGSAAWSAASPHRRGLALMTAASMLDTMPWSGEAVSRDQPMAFPRAGSYFDPRLGTEVEMSGIPGRVAQASMDLALHLVANDDVLESGPSVRNLSVGSISLEFVQKTPKMPQHVRALVGPLLEGGGARLWWRAN